MSHDFLVQARQLLFIFSLISLGYGWFSIRWCLKYLTEGENEEAKKWVKQILWPGIIGFIFLVLSLYPLG